MAIKIHTSNPIDRSIQLALGALKIQKKAFHITSENMANAHNIAPPGQKPYQKKVIIVTENPRARSGEESQKMQVKFMPSPGKKVYDPGHPYADKNGYKTVSDINSTQEMVNALSYKENIDRFTLLHQMAYGIKKQDLDLLAEK